MKIQVRCTGVDEKEVFRFFDTIFYPGRAWKLLQEGKIRPKLTEFHIEQWAKQYLGLNKKEPDKRPLGFIRINYDHLDSIDEERLNEPGLIVVTKLGGILIDGQHRLAKRYLSGLDTMQVYVLSEKQAQTHKIMRTQK